MGGAAVQTTRLYEVSVFELVRYWYHTDAKVFPLELILEDTIFGATIESSGSELSRICEQRNEDWKCCKQIGLCRLLLEPQTLRPILKMPRSMQVARRKNSSLVASQADAVPVPGWYSARSTCTGG